LSSAPLSTNCGIGGLGNGHGWRGGGGRPWRDVQRGANPVFGPRFLATDRDQNASYPFDPDTPSIPAPRTVGLHDALKAGDVALAGTRAAATDRDFPPGPAAATPDATAGASFAAASFAPVPLPASDDAARYRTVMVAIWANVAICAAKSAAFLATGSSAMLAEAVHSLVDVANQSLLRLGVLAARRTATADHPYGYSKDVFVWSLIAGVGIFCLGGGLSLMHGVQALVSPGELQHLEAGVGVMGVSAVVEGYSLKVAFDTVRGDSRRAGMGAWEYLRRGRDPTTTAVLVEDTASVVGVLVAGTCLALAHVTGNVVWDAAGSIFIGTLLAASAGFLINTNRKVLIGRAMAPEERSQVLDLLRCDPVVAAVYDTKSEELGPGLYRFKAEVEFSGDQVVRRHLDRVGRGALGALRDAGARGDDAALELAARTFGRDVISASGAEIDRIEQEIKRAVRGVRHVDIETDRGRSYLRDTLGPGGTAGPMPPETAWLPDPPEISQGRQDG